jgi:hypothetical protein
MRLACEPDRQTMPDAPAATEMCVASRPSIAPLRALIGRSWPLPALVTWAIAWALYRLLHDAGASPLGAAVLAAASAVAPAALADRPTRRRVTLLGFPASLMLAGIAAAGPAWPWLLGLALLALAYPLGSWRDAPFFPTPADALQAMPAAAPLAAGARVLDAGCGLGHGLAALRGAYPCASFEGVESSWPLALAARLRYRWARVRRGDMWAADWSGFDLVYLFQRPESLPRALAKARREMRPGSWLASLEFAHPTAHPDAMATCPDGRPLWLYRTRTAVAPAQGPASNADKNASGPASGPGSRGH